MMLGRPFISDFTAILSPSFLLTNLKIRNTLKVLNFSSRPILKIENSIIIKSN